MTDYLFARPSFLAGAARTLDLFGTFGEYNQSPSTDVADFVALANDWQAVGIDIARATGVVGEELEPGEAVGA